MLGGKVGLMGAQYRTGMAYIKLLYHTVRPFANGRGRKI